MRLICFLYNKAVRGVVVVHEYFNCTGQENNYGKNIYKRNI